MAAAQIGVAMNALRMTFFSLLLLIATAPLMAQGTYTQIDYPGATGTSAYGINSAGDIVGYYADASQLYHGFLYSAGTWITIDYPSISGTQLYGINDLGQIVGEDGASGFLYDTATQTFTTVGYPNATQSFPTAINNAGRIVGFACVGFGHFIGFYFVGSTYTVISPGPAGIVPLGLSSTNKVVGTFYGRQSTTNFIFSKGQFSFLNPPSVPNPLVFGINPAGTSIVGTSYPGSGTASGFVYQGRTLTTLQFPGSNYTVASGINSIGMVVGYFVDANGVGHGFTWTPPADAPKS